MARGVYGYFGGGGEDGCSLILICVVGAVGWIAFAYGGIGGLIAYIVVGGIIGSFLGFF